MYKVKIIEKGKKVKTIDFIGEFNEEVRQQWEKIKKHAKSTIQFEFMPYSSQKIGGDINDKE